MLLPSYTSATYSPPPLEEIARSRGAHHTADALTWTLGHALYDPLPCGATAPLPSSLPNALTLSLPCLSSPARALANVDLSLRRITAPSHDRPLASSGELSSVL